MKKKEDKNKDLASLQQDLAGLKNLFVTGYEKIKVSQDFELRKAIRNAGGKRRVIKNNLSELAGAGTPSEQVLKDLRGMTSLAYTTDDPVALAKALTAYAKINPSIYLQGGPGGRPGDRRQSHQRTGGDALEGSHICQTALRDQRAGAATGDGYERRRPQPGGGSRSGREGKQVLRMTFGDFAEAAPSIYSNT